MKIKINGNLKAYLMIMLPFTFILLFTAINFKIADKTGKPLGYITSIEEKYAKYMGLGVYVEDYSAVASVEEKEDMIATYNYKAGTIETWSETGIDFLTYTKYKDDFIFVNGEIAQSENIDDNHIEYTYDNGKQLSVSRDAIESARNLEFTVGKHILKEPERYAEDIENGTKTYYYSDGTAEVYRYYEEIVVHEDGIKIVKISIFNILITYIIVLCIETLYVGLIFFNKRKSIDNK